MDQLQPIIDSVFTICILPMLGVLTSFLISFIKAKIEDFKTNKDSEMTKKYADIIEQVVTDCVLTTTQTYVDSLKNKGEFNLSAQKEAFQKTYQAVLKTLSDEAKTYIKDVFGDLETYLSNKIEATVRITK